LAEFLGVDLAATSKAMPVTTDDGRVVLALIRGDDRLSESKLLSALMTGSRPSTDDEIRAAFGASGGSLGPVGFEGKVIADLTLQEGQFVAGANRDGFHLRGVEAGRDYEPEFADLREPLEGDRCPECDGALTFQTAIEVGHIFYFADKYSSGLDATFLDEDGKEKPLLGGSYGIGPGRVLAAVVEQSHDEDGIVWPRAIAPYDVHLVVLKGAEEIGEQAAQALSAVGHDVLLDDRDQRPGEKFADADLIGCPIRITAGKKSLEDGKVDFRNRASGAEKRLDVAELGKEV
jgi:prolyl-tRNA synthetase